jgi:opacity protein-like surface antigen
MNYKFGGGADPAAMVNQPAVMPYNWTGFYVGGNAGGGMAASAFTDPCFYCSSASPTGGHFTGGGQAGYNYQFGKGLVGIEADINGNSSFKNSVIGGADQNAMTIGLKADISGTIRARAGLVVNNALVYATGGAAWAKVDQSGIEFNNQLNNANFGRPTGITANASGALWGGVVGAGVEFALRPNWTVGGEFLHTMYQDRDAGPLNANGTNGCGGNGITNCVVRSQLTTDVARVRVNYRFGG